MEPPRRLGGRPERLQGIAGLAGPVVGGAQLQLDLGVGGLVVDAQLERRAQRADRLAERQRGVGGGGRPQVVLDRPLGAVDGRGGGEMVGEVGQSARRVGGAGRLHRLRHLQVQLGPAQARQPVVQRAAHQLVGEPVAQLPGRDLLDHAAAHRLLQRGRQRGVGEPAAAQHRQVELGPGHRGQLQHQCRLRLQPRQPLVDHLAHALGRAQRAQRPGQDGDAVHDLERSRLHQLPP